MYKVLAVVALCVAAATCSPVSHASVSIIKKGINPDYFFKGEAAGTFGVVNPAYRCGGVGTPLQLRISECDGHCTLIPGHLYTAEEDFMPSSPAPSLTLKVEIIHKGFTYTIVEAVLPNSSVQPGFVYTARYNIVPNDILSGEVVEFRGNIMHTDNLLLEICVAADVTIA